MKQSEIRRILTTILYTSDKDLWEEMINELIKCMDNEISYDYLLTKIKEMKGIE